MVFAVQQCSLAIVVRAASLVVVVLVLLLLPRRRCVPLPPPPHHHHNLLLQQPAPTRHTSCRVRRTLCSLKAAPGPVHLQRRSFKLAPPIGATFAVSARALGYVLRWTGTLIRLFASHAEAMKGQVRCEKRPASDGTCVAVLTMDNKCHDCRQASQQLLNVVNANCKAYPACYPYQACHKARGVHNRHCMVWP